MRKVLKYMGGLIAFLTVLVAAAWLLWAPSAKEPDYVFVAAWGGKGSGPGQFHDPTGIAVSDGEVFVSDARNNRIQVFDFEGRFLRQFGELGRPMNLSVADGKLYVADYWNDRIEIFSLDGTPVRTIGGPGPGSGQFQEAGIAARSSSGSTVTPEIRIFLVLALPTVNLWRGRPATPSVVSRRGRNIPFPARTESLVPCIRSDRCRH